jgi:Alpha-L-arabinofuranosidase B (ABFB) domain
MPTERGVGRRLAWLMGVALAALLPVAAHATAYVFPGNLPGGCSGGSGVYACGTLTLSNGDTLAVSATTAITINGNLNTNNSTINASGSTSALTLTVTGQLKASQQAVVNANVTAGSVSDAGGSVTFGGSITTTTGSVSLGSASTVGGSIRTTSGNIALDGSNTVTGSITSASGSIATGSASTIGGNVGSEGAVVVGPGSTVAGTVTSRSSTVSLGASAKSTGDVTSHGGTLTLAGSAAVAACTRSANSQAISLLSGATSGGVCCGSTCSNSCVSNNSGGAMPASCAVAPFVAGTTYSFESWDKAGYYIRHSNYLGYISSIDSNSTSATRQDATFTARAGRADSSCWSFESVNLPGYFLRHNNFVLKLHASDGSALFDKDTTFCQRTGLAGSGISLESINYPGYYIRHDASLALGLAHSDGSTSYPGQSTFQVRSGLSSALVHHLEIRHGTGTGLTCSPSTLTVQACQDASCTSLYTGGLTGTLTATGTPSVAWPSGAGFGIAAGAGSTTVNAQVTSAGSVAFGTTGLSVSPTSSTSCNFGSPACTFTAADSGLLFDVPHHLADASRAVSVSAVRKADNGLACVPAFASVSKPVTFRCSYQNPASGTLPVRVGGKALNAANGSAAACDGAGQAVTLDFDATGTATTTLQYADVGQVSLTATYTGSGSDAGLTLAGSDSFIAAPYFFGLTASAGTRVAGVGFSATVTAQNVNGSTTPNFGREASPEGVALGWVRTQPQGSGASNGAWTGSAGGFSSGSATIGSFQWSEVGRGDLSAVLASGNYLGSGYTAAGSSAGAPVLCAAEWGTCTVPTGATATVYYGRGARLAARSAMTGGVSCANGTFGDPDPGFAKQCWYVATAGSSAASTGLVGPFRPHHFDVAVTPACASGGFGYAGQPIPATVTAKNAANVTTSNYFGSYAKATTLSDPAGLTIGSFTSGAAVAAASYANGLASATPTYSFTAKDTGPQTVAIRATDSDGASSSGYAEGSSLLRSGRLLVANGYGSEKSTLQLAVRTEYWSGQAWQLNKDDSCSATAAKPIAGSAIALSGYRDYKGNAGSWTTSGSAITISNGIGTLALAAPVGGAIGTVDVALNLGDSTSSVDQSCNTAHPASAYAGLAWLRSRNGNCATGWASDPSARAAFGIYSPESKKTVHVREIF